MAQMIGTWVVFPSMPHTNDLYTPNKFWSLIPYHTCYYRGYMYRILICSFVNELRKAHGSALAITQFIHNQKGLPLHRTKTATMWSRLDHQPLVLLGRWKLLLMCHVLRDLSLLAATDTASGEGEEWRQWPTSTCYSTPIVYVAIYVSILLMPMDFSKQICQCISPDKMPMDWLSQVESIGQSINLWLHKRQRKPLHFWGNTWHMMLGQEVPKLAPTGHMLW